MITKIAFAPIVASDSRILLLGTMPSEESIRRQEYYGHKSNQFWKIMFHIFDIPFSIDYSTRIQLLIDHKIALWDVLASCTGQGSLDANIENETPNNFEAFFASYPHIKHIAFTSKNAALFYKKLIGFSPDKEYLTLPSPSPANARMPLEEKIKYWQQLATLSSR